MLRIAMFRTVLSASVWRRCSMLIALGALALVACCELRADDRQTAENKPDDPRWAFRPVAAPALPAVQNAPWCHNSIDRFLLAELEAVGLSPAEPAGRGALLRRLTLDLVGLPPTVDELQSFLADETPESLAKAVDRLLANPHYGERWGRHWLDVVRYADTDGHEFDPDKPHAWRYRDYVIEALNADVPYDQFVTEHLAGDLLPQPRLSADGRSAASPLGTTFWWLGEVQGVPVDPAMAAANLREQQLDVFGRAMLGLTVACARCHEHKFDPITSNDYYALCGFLESTRPVQQGLDAGGQQDAVNQRLELARAVRNELAEKLAPLRLESARDRLATLPETLIAAARFDDLETCRRERPDLYPWAAEVAAAEDSPQHPLYAWSRLRNYSADDGQFAKRRQALAERFSQASQREMNSPPHVFASFDDEHDGWEAVGPALSVRPDRHAANDRLAEGTGCASSDLADALVGRLLSPAFVIEQRYLGYLIAGPARPGKTCVNVLINGQAMPEMQRTGAGPRFTWVTVDVSTMRGREARLEVVDDAPTPGGWVAIDHVVFSDDEPTAPGAYRNQLVRDVLADDALKTPADLANALAALFRNCLTEQATVSLDAEATALRRWLLSASPLAAVFDIQLPAIAAQQPELRALFDRQATNLTQWPGSTLGLVAADGVGHDAPFQQRGLADEQHQGPAVPRRFLAALSGEAPLPISQGSGRLELAAAVVSPQNPLLARVMVNRLWQHHFGRGIVATSDNFGELGERPTHPQLLDHLATRLMEADWSLKAIHRQMVLSQAYAQSTQASEEAQNRDPQNRLLAHMTAQRLEAEAVRDAVLFLAERLDTAFAGPSVPMHIEPWMHGRDLPKTRGPLDGAGRRSVYLEIRRNFPAPLLAAFDFPQPQTSVGRRQTSLSPLQPLALMNDALVRELAERWAARLIATEPAPQQRIERIFLEAFCRLPGKAETATMQRYLTARRNNAAAAQLDDLNIWTGVCLAVMNADEFIMRP